MPEMTKKPLLAGQFIWLVSKKDGKMKPIIGPDPLDVTDDDMFVIADPKNNTKLISVDNANSAIQDFITLRSDEYAVIHNPVCAAAVTEDYPNGSYQAGKAASSMKELVHGKKKVVINGHFPVWPEQMIEVRKIPHLSANQYLMVTVESPEDVDKDAPFYLLTVQCAAITQAMVDGQTETLDEKEKASPKEVKEKGQKEPSIFVLGQRIIIPGSLTPTYIPPSGIELVNSVRDALVPGPTQFCVIIDQNGQPNTYMGSGRVFPGPNDTVRMEGSNKGIYDAYHICPDRGILIRIIANVSEENLVKQLPLNILMSLKKDKYVKGDEIFVGGFDAYIAPCSNFEIVEPESRIPHIGNDHSRVYVHAIGVDQKSGVYVRNVKTGNVELVKGEKALLLDPREQVHVQRTVDPGLWNLMIGQGEPHKKVPPETKGRVTTPWALSVMVPNNKACLIIGKGGRKVEVGPKTILLEFEEVLEVLGLSTGTPKVDRNHFRTCFLRIRGNRVTDEIKLLTADGFTLEVRVQYNVLPVGETDESMVKWFNYKDYIFLVCSHTRSRLRAAAHRLPLIELEKNLPDFVRDTILGVKPVAVADAEGNLLHRPGLLFEENNMMITEVEVLGHTIDDTHIEDIIQGMKRQTAVDAIKLQEETISLATEKTRVAISEEMKHLDLQKAELRQETQIADLLAQNAVDTRKIELNHTFNLITEANRQAISAEEQKLLDSEAQAGRNREAADDRVQLDVLAERRAKIVEFRKQLVELEKLLVEAASTADVARLNAIQPDLIKAIEGLGDKTALAELARHLPTVGGSLGFLTEAGGMKALLALVGPETRFGKAIGSLTVTTQGIEREVALNVKDVKDPEEE